MIPICKLHNIEMEENGFESGYRLWSCKFCKRLNLSKESSNCEYCKKETKDIQCGFKGNNLRVECKKCRTVKSLDEDNSFFR